jgi:aminoglycoside 6'-N-acetyltransferase I
LPIFPRGLPVAEITLRPLAIGDRPAWTQLRHALWPRHSAAELGEELVGMLAEGLAGFGAFDDDMLVGFAEASVRPYGDGCDTAPVAWLEGIYVAPGWRRRGIGARLVAAVEAWARDRGLRELGSDVEIDNATSLASHARWGFAETGRVVMLRKDLR